MALTVPSSRQLHALAAFATRLAAPGFTVGEYAGGTRDERGVIQVPWFDYGEGAEAFIVTAAGNGFVQPFDWMAWAGTARGERLLRDPALVAGASATDLVRIVTACIRGDRFSEGYLAEAFESGLIAAVVRRAAVLAGSG